MQVLGDELQLQPGLDLDEVFAHEERVVGDSWPAAVVGVWPVRKVRLVITAGDELEPQLG